MDNKTNSNSLSIVKLERLILMHIILFGFFLLSCQRELPQPSPRLDVEIPVDQLFNNPWVLLAYGNPDNPTIVPKNTIITMQFMEDGTLSGNSGCNQFSTTFTAESDGSLVIQDEIKTTMMICPKTQMDTENAFLTALPLVSGFNFSQEGRLLLAYESIEGDASELVFGVAQVPLENTNWVLSSFGDPQIPQRMSPGLTITAVFTADGRVTGFSGCNNYSAGFTRQDNSITIGPVASTKIMCPEIMETEESYLTALSYASTYQIVGPNLAITTVDGQVLNFTSSSLPVEKTLWSLVSINSQPLQAGINITAYFEPEPSRSGKETSLGTLAGVSGCNQYSSDYQLSGENLSVSPLKATRMFCEEAVMEVENLFSKIIEGESTFTIQGDNLELNSEDGVLIFSASRTPLTGALWVLEMMGDLEQPQYPVEGSNFSIQFNRSPSSPSGVASGTTGCNEYAAAYTANLTEIKINLPVTTGNTSCVPLLVDQEESYFLALNNANEYRIFGNKLVIPYDNNRQSLVFTATQVGFDTNIPVSSLDDTQWYLWTINNQPILNGSSITALFSINSEEQTGSMQGSSGCNLYTASFGPGLSIETTITSNQACDLPTGVMAQEQSYLQILSRSFGYWLTGDQFILNSGLGTLTYRTSPAPQSADQTHLLQANDWYLVSYNNRLSTPGERGVPFVRFNPGTTMNGYTGCNDFTGTYSTQVNQLTVSDVATTLAACSNQVFADQERTMLQVLQAAGTYQVIESALQIVSDQGVLNFSNTPVTTSGEPRPPEAKIIAPQNAQVGQVIRFDASRSVGDVPITRYQWDFGDGGRGNGSIIEYSYRQPGNFNVQMTVTDQRGYRDSDSIMIEIFVSEPSQPTPTPIQPTVTPPPPTPTPQEPLETPQLPTPTETPGEPEATASPEPVEPTPTEIVEQIPPLALISGPTQGFIGEPVLFDASGSQPGSSPITSYSWNFGDGSSLPQQPAASVSTIYVHGGVFIVTVSVADENGLTASASTSITIQARLDTTVWSLTTLGQSRLIPGTVITLQFLQGQIAGFAGCNTYNGTYSVSQNEDGTFQVTVGDIAFSRLACADEIMQQETRYFELLSSVQSAFINQNYLELQSPNGILAYYEVGSP